MTTLRFGLVGTGPWASIAHGPGLVASQSVDLVGVWGRRTEAAEALAADLGVAAFSGEDGFEAMLDQVDAVAFAVPPSAQGPLALRAARAGKHLLLDKPISDDLEVARELAAAVEEAGVASVVFFTDRFSPGTRGWLADRDDDGGPTAWQGGWMRWFSALQEPDNPYGQAVWRQERGALWDTGPHALSLLGVALGPVVDVLARAGQGDLVHLVVTHESGATSTVTLSQFVPSRL